MIVPSQRVADAINRNQSDSTAWLLRHAIDDALALVKEENCTVPEMTALLEWAQARATDLIEAQAAPRVIRKSDGT